MLMIFIFINILWYVNDEIVMGLNIYFQKGEKGKTIDEEIEKKTTQSQLICNVIMKCTNW